MQNKSYYKLELHTVFEYIAENIVKNSFYDPANKNNIIPADLTRDDKLEIRNKAINALNREFWGQIFQYIRYNK